MKQEIIDPTSFGTDAQRWTDEFIRVFPSLTKEEIKFWFANCIAVAQSDTEKQYKKRAFDLLVWRNSVDNQTVTELYTGLQQINYVQDSMVDVYNRDGVTPIKPPYLVLKKVGSYEPNGYVGLDTMSNFQIILERSSRNDENQELH